ncbi:MAG: hypothetical protein H8F28_21965 [Fibrella sp.]|nr:hypothetical protein [Armatimonadota bacterium]
MKYKTFMLLRNIGGFGLATLAAVGAFLGCRTATQSNQPSVEPPAYNPPPVSQQAVPNVPKQQKPVPTRPATKPAVPVPSGATAALTSRDTEIVALQKEPLSKGKPAGDSTRWLSVGEGFKAEFRADSGSNAWNRVKVDLDSDKKWDEKWDFKTDGSIKRRVSPEDDDNYNTEYRLKSGETKWVRVK